MRTFEKKYLYFITLLALPKAVFTLTEAESETDKKVIVLDCMEVFELNETDTVTDINGFQTVSVSVSACLC